MCGSARDSRYFTMLFTEHAFGRDAFAGSLRPRAARRCSKPSANAGDAGHPSKPVRHEQGAQLARLPEGRLGASHASGAYRHRTVLAGHTRAFYRRYRNGNASTDDFRAVMEGAAGRDLRWFFDQWLTRPGTPRIEGSWHFDAARKQIDLELSQSVAGAFTVYRLKSAS